MMQICFEKKNMHMELIVQFCKGLKKTNLQMCIVSFSLPTPNIPIIHGPKPGFEIPLKTLQKTFSP